VAPKHSPELIRFSTFEVDFRAGELRKQGRRIRLQDLPFQFLTVLLERPGQVVTREELVRRLWSEYVAIDVDNGLNTAAKKLRQALGDDAETPRFIETVPRRGYRFIGPVEAMTALERQDTPAAPAATDTPAPPARPAPDTNSAPALSEPMPHRSSRGWWLALAAAIVLGLVAVRLAITPRRPAVLRTVQLTHTGHVEPYTTILTDGSRIYFNERSGGRWSLAQVSVEGGTPSPISAPEGFPELCAISPNRSELLVTIAAQNQEEAPLWMIPAVAGSARRVGNVLAHCATWSRDGRSIVYGFGSALYRVNSDGTDPRKVADTPGPPIFPRWSPAGQPELLRFTLAGEVSSLWECSPDGSGLRRFPPTSRSGPAGSRGELGAGWTPDGKYYLFESLSDHANGFWAVRETLDVFHPFNRRPFQIYATQTEAGRLVPGMDGKRLFFASGQEVRELVSYDAGRNQFLPFLSGSAVRGVNFSKDGKWVAYETIPEGTLWRSRADGGDRLQLTAPPLRVGEPQWSPDGQHIAFTGGHTGKDGYSVYVVPANGGSVEMVHSEPNAAGSPSWSADSQSLMFGCWRPAVQPESPAVCMLDWKTRQIVVLPGSQGLLRPAWSPDGRYIAALPEGGTQVVLFEIRTRQRTRVAGGANYGIPFWTRDSRYVYFQQVLGDSEQPIFRADVATHAVMRTMSSQQLPQSGFSGYTLTGLTPHDEPIATVLRRNGDLYALDVDLP